MLFVSPTIKLVGDFYLYNNHNTNIYIYYHENEFYSNKNKLIFKLCLLGIFVIVLYNINVRTINITTTFKNTMTMEKNTFRVELPFFAGFYESPIYNCDTLYYEFNDEDNMEYYRGIFEDNGITSDDLDIDMDAYKKAVSKSFCDVFHTCNACPSFIENVKFDSFVSPKYYNYETDKVYANITFDDDWRNRIKEFMTENKTSLKARIKKEWSDRDGFWSFLSSDYEDWFREFDEVNVDERMISVMLQYMMEKTDKDIYEDLLISLLDQNYISEFIVTTDEYKSRKKFGV